jgi:hypothetical protein
VRSRSAAPSSRSWTPARSAPAAPNRSTREAFGFPLTNLASPNPRSAEPKFKLVLESSGPNSCVSFVSRDAKQAADQSKSLGQRPVTGGMFMKPVDLEHRGAAGSMSTG